MTEIIKVNPSMPEKAKIRRAAQLLSQGKVVAFPTETVYGLGCNAFDEDAVEKVFKAKGRPSDNPLIVHIGSKRQLPILVSGISEKEKKLIDAFFPGPLTLIMNKTGIVPYATSGGLETVAIRMPKHKVAQAILKEAGIPIAAPSANISGRPSSTTAEHVISDFMGRVDAIVDGGKSRIGLESTVVDASTSEILRPGGITKEEIEKVIGRVEISTASTNKSPGMKYRHYAPSAKVILFTGRKKAIQEYADRLMKSKKVGVISIYHSFSADEARHAGNSLHEYARSIFALFRELEEKVDVILVEGVEEKGIGIAIMNRLRKAASEIV